MHFAGNVAGVQVSLKIAYFEFRQPTGDGDADNSQENTEPNEEIRFEIHSAVQGTRGQYSSRDDLWEGERRTIAAVYLQVVREVFPAGKFQAGFLVRRVLF